MQSARTSISRRVIIATFFDDLASQGYEYLSLSKMFLNKENLLLHYSLLIGKPLIKSKLTAVE
jgi:hypothetical protein